jgi:hypothetical protein
VSETVAIVVIVVGFYAVVIGLRAFASKRSTGRWRYPGMLKYRSDRWEDRSTLWRSSDMMKLGGHGTPLGTQPSGSGDSDGHQGGSSGGGGN